MINDIWILKSLYLNSYFKNDISVAGMVTAVELLMYTSGQNC